MDTLSCDNWCQKWDWIDRVIGLKTAMGGYIIFRKTIELEIEK
jgi:hypothetical protein